MDTYYLVNYVNYQTILILFLTLIFASYWMKNRSKIHLPPGPFKWPIIGNMLLMTNGSPMKIFKEMRSKYGDIFHIRIGREKIVVLNGYEIIHEALVKRADDFSDRPSTSLVKLRKGKGILPNSGELWKKTRTFTLNAMRDYGFGKKSLETKIMEEVEAFLQVVLQQNGRPFDVQKMIQISVCNVICSIINGKRFEHDDEDLKKLLILLDTVIRQAPPTSLLQSIPFLKYLPFDLLGAKKFENNILELIGFHRKIVDQHRADVDLDFPQDLIDTFLVEHSKNPDSTVAEDENLAGVITDMYNAGTETTSTTIRWAILYLIHNMDIQKRLHKEIQDVVGSSRFPTVSDRPYLPYVDAFITEVLRCSCIVPLSIPHGAHRDIHFRGFIIPKGTVILPNLESIMQDKSVFTNPEKFDPTRFLNKHGEFIGDKRVPVFSLGRRVCLGEALARMELFLFITSIVQRFEILPEDKKNLPPLEGHFGVVQSPMCFRFRAIERS